MEKDSIPKHRLPLHLKNIDEPPGPPSNPQLIPGLDFHALSLLAGLSMFGLLARLGLSSLFNTHGNQVFPLAWTQGTGVFLFGFFVHRRKDTEAFWPALHVALRVGFAGGIATFANWLLQSFQQFSNLNGNAEDWLDAALNGLSHLWITLAVVFCSLWFGRHVDSHLPSFQHRIKPIKPLYAHAISVFCLLLWLGALLIFLLTSETGSFRVGRRVAFSLVFAPVGTWIRWWLGFNINPRSPSWIRLGTWTSNMLSTIIAATAFLLQGVNPLNTQLSLFQCMTLQAIQDGFCGALSTIPAFVEQAEKMHGQKNWFKSWIYVGFWMYLVAMSIVCLIVLPGWRLHGWGPILAGCT